ncbi:MAG: hypothetical protein ACOYOQ_00180 [Microthrixaceae bacterium]
MERRTGRRLVEAARRLLPSGGNYLNTKGLWNDPGSGQFIRKGRSTAKARSLYQFARLGEDVRDRLRETGRGVARVADRRMERGGLFKGDLVDVEYVDDVFGRVRATTSGRAYNVRWERFENVDLPDAPDVPTPEPVVPSAAEIRNAESVPEFIRLATARYGTRSAQQLADPTQRRENLRWLGQMYDDGVLTASGNVDLVTLSRLVPELDDPGQQQVEVDEVGHLISTARRTAAMREAHGTRLGQTVRALGGTPQGGDAELGLLLQGIPITMDRDPMVGERLPTDEIAAMYVRHPLLGEMGDLYGVPFLTTATANQPGLGAFHVSDRTTGPGPESSYITLVDIGTPMHDGQSDHPPSFDTIEEMFGSGASVLDWSVDGMIRHEYGHYMDEFFMSGDTMAGRRSDDPTSKLYQRDRMISAWENVETILSTYAAADHRELAAELFCLISHRDYPRWKASRTEPELVARLNATESYFNPDGVPFYPNPDGIDVPEIPSRPNTLVAAREVRTRLVEDWFSLGTPDTQVSPVKNRTVTGADAKRLFTFKMADGVTAEVRKTERDGDTFYVKGSLIAPDGTKVGEFARDVDANGVYVKNRIFQMFPAYQNKGIGSRFVAESLRRAQAAGFKEARVGAYTDGAGRFVGSYVWARAGFDWSSGTQAAIVADALEQGMNPRGRLQFAVENLTPEVRAKAEAYIEAIRRNVDVKDPELFSEDMPTPNDIAMLGWTPGATTWPGREFLSGGKPGDGRYFSAMEWEGVMRFGVPPRSTQRINATTRPQINPLRNTAVAYPGMAPATDADRERLRIPPAWTDVHVATDPEAPMQARGRDDKGRAQSIYSAEHTEQQAAAKYERVARLVETVDQLDTAIAADMDTNDTAAALKLIRFFGMRPGSTADTGAAKKAYGATTLEVRHVRQYPDTGRTTFSFTGKKGVPITVSTRDPDIYRMIEARVQGKDRRDTLFDTSASQVRDYMNAAMGTTDFNPKDLRTMRANAIAIQMVGSMRRPTTWKKYREARNKVADAVSKELGNTRAVALSGYINPTVFAEWEAALDTEWASYGPRKLAASISKASTTDLRQMLKRDLPADVIAAIERELASR